MRDLKLHAGTLIAVVLFVLPCFANDCENLSKWKFNSSFEASLKLLRDTSVQVKEKAVRQIKDFGGQRPENSWLRDTLIEYALRNLLVASPTHGGSLGQKWLQDFRFSEIPAILKRYKVEPNRDFRRALIASLEGKKDFTIDKILKLAFDDPDSSVVVEAVRIYGKNGFDDSYFVLLNLLDSNNVLKKVGAIRGLKYFKGTDAAYKILDKILRKKDVPLNSEFSLEVGMKTLSKGNTLHKEAYRTLVEIAGKENGNDTLSLKRWIGTIPPLDSLVRNALTHFEDTCYAPERCSKYDRKGKKKLDSLGCDVFPILEGLYSREQSVLMRGRMVEVTQGQLQETCPCAYSGLLRLAMNDTAFSNSVIASKIYAYRQCPDAKNILENQMRSINLIQRVSAIYGVEGLLSWRTVPILLKGLSLPDAPLGTLQKEVLPFYSFDLQTKEGKEEVEKYLSSVHGLTLMTINEIIFHISKDGFDGDTTLIKAWIKKQRDDSCAVSQTIESSWR